MPEIIRNEISETRNSPIRNKVSGFTSAVARFICDRTPNLTANRIGLLGNGLVTLGAIRQSLLLIAIGSLMDAIDGPVARETEERFPGSVDFKKGELFDTLSDRYQEAFLSNERIVSAHQRNDRIGGFAALASAITSSLPSIARAFSESQEKVVPESGKGILGLIGTRPGRAALGAIATVLPEYKGIPVQTGLDILMTVANIKTTSDRLKTAFSDKEKLLPDQKKHDAKVRLTALGLFGALTTGVSLLNYFVLNRKEQPKAEEGESDKFTG